MTGEVDMDHGATLDGLAAALQPSVVAVEDGGTFDLRIHPVAKRIGDATFPMLAYNGSIPGPTLRVRQGSEILVNVTNGSGSTTSSSRRRSGRSSTRGSTDRASSTSVT